MSDSDIEQRIRARLPIARFFQAYVPIWVARWVEKRAATQVRLPAEITHKVVSADGVRCEWLIPQNSPSDQVLLYFHGGGFVYGLTSIHREMVAYLAQKTGVRLLLVDYRLAPEHAFPAALEDCVTAYRWLLKQGITAPKIVVAGDSAGGNLTITTLMQLRDNHDPLPAGAACLSPVIDLRDKSHRFREVNEPLLHPKAVKFFSGSYLAQNDVQNPLISPLFGNWQGLPPLLVHAGEEEILLEDSIRLQEKASAAGVEVQLEIYPRMWHVWQLYPELAEARRSLDDIARFLQSHLQRTSVHQAQA